MSEYDGMTVEDLLAELGAKHREIADLIGQMVDRVALHNQRVTQTLHSATAMYVETPLATCERFAAEHDLTFSLEGIIYKTPAVAFFKGGKALLWRSQHFAYDHRLRRPCGRWLGSDRMPALHKASHDLLLSAVVLVYFAQDPAIFDSWTSERELEFRHRSGTYRGPIADGYVEIDGTPWLVEVGGLYGASMLKKKIEHAQRAGLNWNLW